MLTSAIIATLLAGSVVSREKEEPGRFPWWFKVGILLEYIGVGVVAAVSMYVVYTPVGTNDIYGCQGRYLLPAIFPVLFIITRFSGKTFVKDWIGERNINICFMALMIAFSLQGLWQNCIMLY